MLLRLLQRSLLLLCMAFININLTAQSLTFTAIPDQDETALKQRFAKVASYLQSSTGLEVNYIPVKSYAAAISAFRNNQVQLAWFGGLSGVRARQQVPGSTAIAQGVEDALFQSYLIAHHSTGLESDSGLTDSMQGLSLTFGSKGSTSGRLMPEYYLQQHFKLSPRKVFSTVGFSGNHSRTIALVSSGAYQLGAVNFKVWQQAQAKGLIDNNKVKVVWRSPSYPDYQWTLRGDIDQQLGQGSADKIAQALLNLKDQEVLAAFPRSGFIRANNALYAPIKTTARAIGLLD